MTGHCASFTSASRMRQSCRVMFRRFLAFWRRMQPSRPTPKGPINLALSQYLPNRDCQLAHNRSGLMLDTAAPQGVQSRQQGIIMVSDSEKYQDIREAV